MGAVRVQTADRNITNNPQINNTTPVKRKAVFVINKCIITMFSSNCYFRLKYESSIHNIGFSSEKAVSTESVEKYSEMWKQF